MKIKEKLIIAFLAIVTIPMILIEVSSFTSTKRLLEQEAILHLNLLAMGKESAVMEYIASKKGRAVDFAKDIFIRKETEHINSIEDSEAKKRSAKNLNTYLKMNRKQLDQEIIEVHVYDIEGNIIASSDEADIGKTEDKEQPFFIMGKKATYMQEVIEHEHEGATYKAFAVASPLKSFDDKRVIGVLINEYRMDGITGILSGERHCKILADEKEKDIDTGTKVYIVNKHKKVIFWFGSDDAELIGKDVDTEPVKKCLNDSEELDGKWLGYNGKTVWGSSMCLEIEKDNKWVLIAAMHEDKALEHIIRHKNLILVLGMATLLIVTLVAFSIANTISRPIKALHEGTEIIGSGDLDHKVGTDSKDEIGQLSRAFDEMTGNLKSVTATRDELNKEISERKKAEETVIERNEFLYNVLKSLTFPFYVINAANYTIMLANSAALKGGSLKDQHCYELTHHRSTPCSGSEHKCPLEEVKRTKKPVILEHIHFDENGDQRNVEVHGYPILDSKGNVVQMIEYSQDITERKLTEVELRHALAEIERSNKELEHFAYIVSHDLQEPLRMISSYVQLIAKRYKGKLDSDADEFIHFTVDGATRMQGMINDMLAYSRVGTRGKDFQQTDLSDSFANALINLKTAIEESEALVTNDPLPTIMADGIQLVQLFQNLIANAIKFHDKERPRIHVSAEKKEDEWIFSVKDNGIGIPTEQVDRIFLLFQRLHSTNEYAGTGIGLAVCKKIVERHKGRIWVESELGKGSIFKFTIPANLTKGPESEAV